jgi:hypothetical protein
MPDQKINICLNHYAASYWDAGLLGNPPGIAKSGLAGVDSNWGYGSNTTEEYLNPNSLPDSNYKDHPIASGSPMTFYYSEAGQYTWKIGTVFGISYQAFGVTISLETTVSDYSSCSLSFTIYNTSGKRHMFRAYTCGHYLDDSTTPGNGIGGVELHVWDMGETS